MAPVVVCPWRSYQCNYTPFGLRGSLCCLIAGRLIFRFRFSASSELPLIQSFIDPSPPVYGRPEVHPRRSPLSAPLDWLVDLPLLSFRSLVTDDPIPKWTSSLRCRWPLPKACALARVKGFTPVGNPCLSSEMAISCMIKALGSSRSSSVAELQSHRELRHLF